MLDADDTQKATNKGNVNKNQDIPKEKDSQNLYNERAQKEMSKDAALYADEKALGKESSLPHDPQAIEDGITLQGAQTANTNENAKIESPEDIRNGTDRDPLTAMQGQFDVQASSDEAGEQSISGDMPTPDSDDDTLANAQAVGTQTNEDPEHPEELDIARDVDKAEEYERQH